MCRHAYPELLHLCFERGVAFSPIDLFWQARRLSLSLTHTLPLTHTHTHSLAHTLSHTHSLSLTHTHTQTQTLSHTLTHSLSLFSLSHTLTHTLSHAHTLSHSLSLLAHRPFLGGMRVWCLQVDFPSTVLILHKWKIHSR